MLEGIQPTEEWQDIYWGMNMPLQMWGSTNETTGEREYAVLNYMPRKERCQTLESRVTQEELPQFCKNAAVVLRNLASLFEALGEGKIRTIYYPDQTVEEAVKSKLEDEAEELSQGEHDDPVGNAG